MTRDFDVPKLVLVGFALLVGSVLVVGGATSAVAFDAFNPQWDGTSELQATAEATGTEPVIVRNTTRYDEYGANATAFVIAPTEEYTDGDIERIHAFVERGGTLVVADRDGPHGHALLADLGASARPVGPVLRDERHYYRDPALPIATVVDENLSDAGAETISLNDGTAIEPDGATVLAASSEYAYLDSDGSGAIADNESLASYPVVTTEAVGDGRIVTVGDPSVFINVMHERDDNRAFVAALLADADHTLVDISRAGAPPPLVAVLLIIRESLFVQTILGIGGLVLVRAGRQYISSS